MARTTAAAVQAILSIGGDYDTINSPSLTQVIDPATLLVDRVEALAIKKETPLLAAELEILERWIAAHIYAMADQPYETRTTDRGGAKFQGKTGMYLEGTKYGQMAINLDYSGALAELNAIPIYLAGAAKSGLKPEISAAWLGS